MGNIGFLVPTKKLEDWNRHRIGKLLKDRFPNFEISIDPTWEQIDVIKKGGFLARTSEITTLYFNQDCYILNYSEDIKWLEENNMQDLAQKLIELQELNPDLNNVIQMTHGGFHKERNSVEKFLMEYFGAFSFDEGIHPEYMPPDYKFKQKNLAE